MKSFTNHFNNLSVLVGHDVTNKYSYIVTKDQLTEAFMKSREGRLPYSLKKEVKRDRYVMNTEGLQKDIEAILEDLVKQVADAATELIAHDAERTIAGILDNINIIDNKLSMKGVKVKSSNTFAARLGKLMGKAVVKAADDILKSVDR